MAQKEKQVGSLSKKRISKVDLLKAWWKWCLSAEVPHSFDRMQALSFSYSLNKVLRKMYKNDPDELQNAMERHAEFFNSNPDWGSVIHGIVISMEEERANGNKDITPEMITSIKVGLMGPLAGIGDSVDQGIVGTIPLAIFVPMALQGSVVAAFIPALILMGWSFGWSWILFSKGYSLGKEAVINILHSGAIKKLIDGASILGLFMMGSLAASYVQLNTIVKIPLTPTKSESLQTILNEILPNMLPFLVVMGIYLYLEKHRQHILGLIIFIIVAAILLTFLKII